MTDTIPRIMTAIQLTRLTVAFGAISDLWFVILLTRAGMAGGPAVVDGRGAGGLAGRSAGGVAGDRTAEGAVRSIEGASGNVAGDGVADGIGDAVDGGVAGVDGLLDGAGGVLGNGLVDGASRGTANGIVERLADGAAASPTGIAVIDMPLSSALAAGAIVAVGLFAYGASLNDVLDVRHDSTFSPDRPIPAGRIGHTQAMVLTVGALIVAVLGAAWISTWSVCITLLVAAGLLFYNATGKYIPAAGVITLGLIHAAHMFIPNDQLAFTWPVWLVMTHAVGIAAAVHVLEQKRPRFDRRGVILAVTGWLFWSLILLWVARVGGGEWPADIPAWRSAIPLVVGLSFILVVRWKTAKVSGKPAAEKVRRYGAMWQSLYGAAWLLALGLEQAALWIGLFALGGFGLMTLIKEVTGLSGKPVAYR
ncbi:MAG: hypothetical protein AB8G96_00665 [Phycisphaerales bacterium]